MTFWIKLKLLAILPLQYSLAYFSFFITLLLKYKRPIWFCLLLKYHTPASTNTGTVPGIIQCIIPLFKPYSIIQYYVHVYVWTLRVSGSNTDRQILSILSSPPSIVWYHQCSWYCLLYCSVYESSCMLYTKQYKIGLIMMCSAQITWVQYSNVLYCTVQNSTVLYHMMYYQLRICWDTIEVLFSLQLNQFKTVFGDIALDSLTQGSRKGSQHGQEGGHGTFGCLAEVYVALRHVIIHPQISSYELSSSYYDSYWVLPNLVGIYYSF